MAAFPAGEVERIINEEIVRGQGTKLWTTPQARRRYQKMLATLVLGDRATTNDLSGLLDAVFDGHYELAPYCREREQMYAFAPDALGRLTTLLEQVRGVLGRTLSAQLYWPADAVIAREQGGAFLSMQHEQLGGELAHIAVISGRGGTVGFLASRAVTLDQSLQACRYLLMTQAESLEFDAHYDAAQRMLRQASPLFNMPDATVN